MFFFPPNEGKKIPVINFLSYLLSLFSDNHGKNGKKVGRGIWTGEGGVIFESGEEVKKPYGNCCLKIPGMISIYDRYCHLAIMSEKCHENGSYR